MPNGFHGSVADWAALEAPLAALDAQLTAFAHRHGLQLEKSTRNWPSRSLRWQAHGLERLIQIYLADEKRKTYHFWLCATASAGRGQHWKSVFLKKEAPLAEIAADLEGLLQTGYQRVAAWTAADLAPVQRPRDAS